MAEIKIESKKSEQENMGISKNLRNMIYLAGIVPIGVVVTIPLAWAIIILSPLFLLANIVAVAVYAVAYPLFERYFIDNALAEPVTKNTAMLKKLLLVDDDDLFSEGLARMLKKSEFMEVEIINDPLDAIERVLNQHYDLIVLDQKMPKLNGDKLLSHLEDSAGIRTLRGNKSASSSPVLFCSVSECASVTSMNNSFYPVVGAIKKTSFNDLASRIENIAMKTHSEDDNVFGMAA